MEVFFTLHQSISMHFEWFIQIHSFSEIALHYKCPPLRPLRELTNKSFSRNIWHCWHNSCKYFEYLPFHSRSEMRTIEFHSTIKIVVATFKSFCQNVIWGWPKSEICVAAFNSIINGCKSNEVGDPVIFFQQPFGISRILIQISKTYAMHQACFEIQILREINFDKLEF